MARQETTGHIKAINKEFLRDFYGEIIFVSWGEDHRPCPGATDLKQSTKNF
jgi:hypothetical protein